MEQIQSSRIISNADNANQYRPSQVLGGWDNESRLCLLSYYGVRILDKK